MPLEPIFKLLVYNLQHLKLKFELSVDLKKVFLDGYRPIYYFVNFIQIINHWKHTVFQIWEVSHNQNQSIDHLLFSFCLGASTQMSFVSPEAVQENIMIPLFETSYPIYSYSYLCYGTEQLRLMYLSQLIRRSTKSSIVRDPCLQKGFNQTMTYDDIFSTACARGKYAPPTELSRSSTFTLV